MPPSNNKTILSAVLARMGATQGKDSTHQAVAKRLRKDAMRRGNAQRAEVESKHPFRNEPSSSGVKAQPGSFPPKGK